MTSNVSKLLLLGLQGSGKTSYLAALWHLVEAVEVPVSLSSSKLQPDREYLNRIRTSWLAFEEVDRTPLRADQAISLMLSEATTGASVEIALPDLSGELFRLQWAMRKATRGFAEFAKDCDGLLLFIHPFKIKRAPVLQPEESSSREAGSGQQPADQKAAGEWTPEQTPTQVQLVELVQFVRSLRFTQSTLRLAVVVSAWDLIRDSLLPQAWIEHRLPLLSQYLVANSKDLPSQIFGVSALGGDLERDLPKLKAENIPARRVRVVEQSLDPHHDLTAPLRFILAAEGDNRRTPRGVVSNG